MSHKAKIIILLAIIFFIGIFAIFNAGNKNNSDNASNNNFIFLGFGDTIFIN